ncbi:hypothetical protein H8959_021146 [Pygathrix nigripes]
MAELFMECEEEELEPWQKKVEETQDEDDDELIFVGEISSSKPAISNILNRGHSSSSSKGIKSEPHSPDGLGDIRVYQSGDHINIYLISLIVL